MIKKIFLFLRRDHCYHKRLLLVTVQTASLHIYLLLTIFHSIWNISQIRLQQYYCSLLNFIFASSWFYSMFRLLTSSTYSIFVFTSYAFSIPGHTLKQCFTVFKFFSQHFILNLFWCGRHVEFRMYTDSQNRKVRSYTQLYFDNVSEACVHK